MHRVAVTLLICCWPLAADAAPVHVHVVLADDGPAYRAALATVRDELGPGVRVSDGLLDDEVGDAAVIVAIGTAAARRWAASDDARPVLATLVPAASWSALVDREVGVPRSAVYLDQPLERQTALIRVLLPPARDVGVVYGPSSIALAHSLEAAAARHNLRLHHAEATAEEPVTNAVNQALRVSSVLLALPDPLVYNRYTVQAILLSTFRMRRPVIGFSESWVHAGALAAVYSTPAQLGAELGAMLSAWLADGGDLPPARPSGRYTVLVNRQVAYSLGLNVPADRVILQELRALEDEQ